jgi:hypothetical protein
MASHEIPYLRDCIRVIRIGLSSRNKGFRRGVEARDRRVPEDRKNRLHLLPGNFVQYGTVDGGDNVVALQIVADGAV